ncbi:hypothetical protein ES703_25475 [subsurface metagenome]
MAKLKNPLLSLGAVGRLAKHLSLTRRRRQNIIEATPVIKDAKTLAQLSWRHMYQKAVALWLALSAAEKQEWESLARSKHMTGFAWFMSQALKPNPGLYLPLQGGTMAGNIDMAKNRLLRLPAPVDAQEPMRLGDGVPVHGPALHTDQTRYKFIPMGEALIWAGNFTSTTDTPCLQGDANADQPRFVMSISVPSDFVAFVKLEALWTSVAAAGNMYWQLRAYFRTCGEAMNSNYEAPGYGVTPTLGADILNCQEPANPLTLAGLAKNDIIGTAFYRAGAHALDTLDQAVCVYGLLFTYTAEQ